LPANEAPARMRISCATLPANSYPALRVTREYVARTILYSEKSEARNLFHAAEKYFFESFSISRAL
jgi:hypothetical protein